MSTEKYYDFNVDIEDCTLDRHSLSNNNMEKGVNFYFLTVHFRVSLKSILNVKIEKGTENLT
jgi:hypothetical protein